MGGTAAVNKPSIVSVIGERVELRKAGKEFIGRCPFHADQTPSFSVNEEKGLFHCFGCGESGDVFSFIMKLDGVSFPEACARLGLDSRQPGPQAPDALLNTARAITVWANKQTAKANSLLRDIGQRMRLAKELQWQVQRLSRAWIILVDLSEDLQDPSCAISLWESRDTVENLLQDAEPEAPEEFPPLTDEYREQLRRYVRGYHA
jgi:hypothetical protein